MYVPRPIIALYQDDPLQDTDFIRLSILHPDDNDADIKVSIETAQLSAKLSFIALFYT